MTTDATEGWLVVACGPLRVCANLGSEAVRLGQGGDLLLASRPDVAVGAEGLHLPPTSVAILEAPA